MKKLVQFYLICLFIPCIMAEEKVADPVVEIATKYFSGLVGGDLDTVNALVGAPYSFDRKNILNTLDEVKATHKKIVRDKGKRAVPKVEISRPVKYKELNKDVFKEKYEVVRFVLLLEGKHKGDSIDIYVKKVGGKYQIIGLSD